MKDIRFSRLISDGAIFQRNKKIHIWGFSLPNAEVCVKMCPENPADNRADRKEFYGAEEALCSADAEGRFEVFFKEREAGGPYVVRAEFRDCDEKCEGFCEARDILVGDVFVISGQSNMEFPMIRVKDTYPEEWDNPKDDKIRKFKIVENGVFSGPVKDVATGEWVIFNKDSIDDFSAVGYFMAEALRASEDVPVGLIDISLGGAPIEAFMSAEMLEGFDEAQNEIRKFADDEYRNEILRLNEENALSWHRNLDESDMGLKEGWQDGKEIILSGKDFCVPEYFSDTELGGFIGTVWFARKFNVPKEYAGREALLWFGTITDYDSCYLNGELIGTTPYCYPPRRYPIPAGLLKEGENTVVFRICVEKGFGRITPGKLLGVIFGNGRRITDGFTETIEGAEQVIGLSGVWKYLKGCGEGVTEKIAPPKDMVFVNWKPTALFNGMLAPVTNYPIKAFCFYQGETNCPRAFEYAALTAKQIEGYRELWKDEKLPYVYVQLPNFNARVEENSYDGGIAWRNLQRAQEEVLGIDNVFMAVSYGFGESNDLHPQRKKPVGIALAEIVSHLKRPLDSLL